MYAQKIIYKKSRMVGALLTFEYDSKVVQKIKNIPGRQYHPSIQSWSVPISGESLNVIQDMGFSIDPDLLNMEKSYSHFYYEDFSLGFPTPYPIKPFQLHSIQFLLQNKDRGMIADEMGLGKTVQTILFLKIRNFKKIIIITTASMKFSWKDELKLWGGMESEILFGQTPYTPKESILILNYTILPYWWKFLQDWGANCMVGDESHYISNYKAKRTKSMIKLCKNIPSVVLLTGTPILNMPFDLHPQLYIIDPIRFKNRLFFLKRYCNPKHNGFGWEYKGSTNEKELHSILHNQYVIRRIKKDVLPELPPKTYSKIIIPLSNFAEYRFAEQDFLRWYADSITKSIESSCPTNKKIKVNIEVEVSTVSVLAQYSQLRKLCGIGKIQSIIDFIDDFLKSGEKLVVMGIHRDVLQHLYAHYQKIAVLINGSVTPELRQKHKNNFQKNKKIKIFFGNVVAAGEGLTLTAANTLLLIEWPYNPGKLNQVVDRVHRISQTKPVTIYGMVAQDTIEEKIINSIMTKDGFISPLLDGMESVLKKELSKKQKI